MIQSSLSSLNVRKTTLSKSVFDSRVRTALLRLEGGLKYNQQCVRIGVYLPTKRKDGEILRSKLYIASGMFDNDNLMEKPKEYLSLRMANLMEINSFAVGFFLAAREFAKYEDLDVDYVYDGLIKRLMAAFKTGNYDAQIHYYG